MKISAINNNQYQANKNQTSFKQIYPVVHWVGEANKRHFPLVVLDEVKDFHEVLISALNKGILKKKEIKELTAKKVQAEKGKQLDRKEKNAVKKLRDIIDVPRQIFCSLVASFDTAYRTCFRKKDKVRSFYDEISTSTGDVIPVAYILSGEHVIDFIKKFGKPIGKGYIEGNGTKTEKVKQKIKEYFVDGLKYVKDPTRRKKNEKGELQVLHTKFDTVRDEQGNLLGYRLVSAKLFPEFGPESPFEVLKHRK